MKRRFIIKRPFTDSRINKFICQAKDGDLISIKDSVGKRHELQISIVSGAKGVNWVLTTTDSRVKEYNSTNNSHQLEYSDYIRHLRNNQGRALFNDQEIYEILTADNFVIR